MTSRFVQGDAMLPLPVCPGPGATRSVRGLVFVAAMTGFVLAGGRLAAHDPLSSSGGGPGAKAVVVDVGPAPGHVLDVSNWGGEVEETDMTVLVQAVRERLAGAGDRRPWVRGHRDATYDAVLKVMGRLSAAGMRVAVFMDRDIWERAQALAKREDRR